MEIVPPFWIGQPKLVGLDAEQNADVEGEQSKESLHAYLESNGNGNQNEQPDEVKILLSEQNNEKENIQIGEANAIGNPVTRIEKE